jgi:hypothetical protein
MSPGTRRTFLCLSLLLTSCLWAQPSADDKEGHSTIEYAKKMHVSSIDARLPKVSLEFFLNYESEGSPIHWELNYCGEQTGNPSEDQGRNFPVCVEADFDVHHRSVSVVVAIGTPNQGDRRTPSFFSGTITAPDGASHSFGRLGDLPAQLRRRFLRQSREPPDVRAFSDSSYCFFWMPLRRTRCVLASGLISSYFRQEMDPSTSSTESAT